MDVKSQLGSGGVLIIDDEADQASQITAPRKTVKMGIGRWMSLAPLTPRVLSILEIVFPITHMSSIRQHHRDHC